MVPALKLIVLVLSLFPAITYGHFQPKPTESVWIGDEIVLTGRHLVSSKSSKSSPTGNARRERSSYRKGEPKSEASRKGTDDSGTPRSERDDSSRNVARSPSESASRPRNSTKNQSRSRSNNSRSSATKRGSDNGESKRKKKKSSRSDPGSIFGGQSVGLPTLSLLEPTFCDAKMRKCGRERRPIYALDLKEYTLTIHTTLN